MVDTAQPCLMFNMFSLSTVKIEIAYLLATFNEHFSEISRLKASLQTPRVITIQKVCLDCFDRIRYTCHQVTHGRHQTKAQTHQVKYRNYVVFIHY